MTTEHRNSYRCESIDEGQKAVIKVGGRDVIAQVINQSAGGFSVSITTTLRVSEGKTLRVRTSAGWFEAQVIHKQVVDGTTTLGLVRVREFSDPRDAQLVKSGGRKYETCGSGSTPSGVLLMLMIVAAMAFWCSMWFQGVGGSAVRRVNLNAYVSQFVGDSKSSPQVDASAADGKSQVEASAE